MPLTEVDTGTNVIKKSEPEWAKEIAKLQDSAGQAVVKQLLKSAGLKEGIIDLIIDRIKVIVSPLKTNPPPSRHAAESLTPSFSAWSMQQAYDNAIQLAGDSISDLVPDNLLLEHPLLPAMIIRCAIRESWAW